MNSTETKTWTILSLLETSTNYLLQKNFDDARLSVEILLSDSLKLPRIQLYSQFDKVITQSELLTFKKKFTSLVANEPLQYIVGQTSFYGLQILCDKRALIPRPETEPIVEKCIEYIKLHFPINKQLSVLEVGTGTGCISIALAKSLSNLKIMAIDIDEHSLNLANENIKLHSLTDRIELKKVDINNFISNLELQDIDIIISNPPYISKEEYQNLPIHIHDHEPRHALTDENDGLQFYHKLNEISQTILKQNGLLIIEHGSEQSEKVKEIFSNEVWNYESSIIDMSKHVRGAIYKFQN